jgi:hypothetical protein
MNWLGLAIQITGIALFIWILALLWRRNLLRIFPFFFSYILYSVITTTVRSITLSNPHVYFYVYWITTPVQVILAILAVHESFLRVFRVFYLLPWFRFCFPSGIAIALLYSALRGWFYPPVHASRAGTAIISTMMTAQYVILTISLGFFALVKLLHVRWRIHEYRFVLGFGISSAVIAFAASVRSEFGTRFAFLSGMIPAVAYMLVLVIWLSAVVYPLPAKIELAGEQLSQLSPEEVVSRLRRELAMIRSLLRRR